MPTSKEGKPYASRFKTDVSVDQTNNVGFDSQARLLVSGDGASSSMSLSDDVCKVTPQNDNTSGTFLVTNKGASNILAVDTSSSLVKAGASQVNALTLFKDMGLFDFSPAVGYHYPLIANNMMFSDSGADIIADDSMFSNGTDPATTLDLSSDGTPMIAVACYWYLDNDITLDSVRFMATADGSDDINFHIMSYTLDTSSQHGDLSAGAVHAYSAAVSLTTTTVKTGTFTISSADINAGKVVIGFVESDSTTDVTCSVQIKYHIR